MNSVNIPQEDAANQQEVEKLQLENAQLKKKLEQEELLHKSLYKQWTELNDNILARKRQMEQFSWRTSFYKYAFYVVVFACIPVYYFLVYSKEDGNISPDPQAASSPAPTTNPSPVNRRDTAQLADVKPAENAAIRTDTVQQKLPAINNPIVDKPLTSSIMDDKPITGAARDSIYSQGWDAYYKQLRNPYQRSSQKFKVWLEGWKDAEKGVKKVLAKAPLAH